MAKPDFSDVRSLDDARRLEREGALVKLLLFPEEFGGEDVPRNVVYVTPVTIEARRPIIRILGELIENGTIDELNVVPAYRRDSFVPVRIAFHATHKQKAGAFNAEIEIW